MIAKIKILPALFASSLLLGGFTGVSADDPISEKELLKAEKRLFQECVEDDSNEAAKCQCLVATFKKELPRDHYLLMMDFVNHGLKEEDGDINMDDEQAEKIMERHDASIWTVLKMTLSIVEAADELEKCDNLEEDESVAL